MEKKQTDVSGSLCDLRQPGVLSAISGLAGRIAHDFNNLITPLLAYPPLIRRDIPDGSQSLELLAVIERAARDMSYVTRQLQGLVRRNYSGIDRAVDLNYVVKNCVENLKHELVNRNSINIECRYDESEPKVFASEEDIAAAVLHLLTNAVEAIGEKEGTITISTLFYDLNRNDSSIYGGVAKEGKYTAVVVSDTGEGVKEELLERIFEPCFTTRKNQKRRGAGFGLAIVYKIMSDYNGYVGVVSEPGKGAQFSLYFPLDNNTSVGQNEASSDTAERSTAGKGAVMHPSEKNTVLLVDDEKNILQLFKAIINSSLKNVRVDTAANGAEAVGTFSEIHHKVVVMDLHMPVMDGMQAFMEIQRICSEKGWEMPAVIFCTGFAPPDTVKNLIKNDSKHYLISKPVTSDKLLEVISAKLAG